MERNEFVNMDDALKRVRGNKGMYARMLKLFLASEDFDKLEAAIGQKDCKTASEMAHSIKGVTGNLSLTKLFEESAALMIKLREDILDEDLISRYRYTLGKTKEYVNEVLAEIS